MAKGSTQAKKDSDKAPAPKNVSANRRKARGNSHNDDDSVDSKGNIRNLIVSSDEEDAPTEETIVSTVRKTMRASAKKAQEKIVETLKAEKESSLNGTLKNTIQKKRKITEITDDEEDDEDEDDDSTYNGDGDDEEDLGEDTEDEDEESEEDEEDDYDDEYETEEESDEDSPKKRSAKEKPPRAAEISISFGSMGPDRSEMDIPKRHNLKKESALVRKFVKLATAPIEQDNIDGQIDQFKELPNDKQQQLVEALELKSVAPQENMMFKILTMNVKQETKSMILGKYNALREMDPSSGEYYKHRAWLEKLTSVPLGCYKEMPVSLTDGSEKCGEFMEKARASLATAIYGQQESKLQILQYIASNIANPKAGGLSLLLVGPPGIGKTSLIKNGIAKALNWPFQFISLGGDSDATTYTGHQVVYEGSHAGKIVNSLINAKSMSMVLMFDELDKISATAKGEEVQNLLIHMTDPVQNCEFEDKYLSGIPLDLSRSMFVFSGNDISKIDKVLLDRMIVIKLKGYDKKEKVAIAENFILPGALKDVNLLEKVAISHEIIEYIVTEYSGDEAGVRELKRCIEQITQKINMLRIFNTKDLPFHIPEFQLPFVVKKSHVDLFLKKPDSDMDVSVQRMYL